MEKITLINVRGRLGLNEYYLLILNTNIAITEDEAIRLIKSRKCERIVEENPIFEQTLTIYNF